MRPPNTRPAIAVTSHAPTGPTLLALVCCTRTRPIVPINKHTPQPSCVNTPASRNKARPGGRGEGAGPDTATEPSLLRDPLRSGPPTHDAAFGYGWTAILPTGDETREPATAIHTCDECDQSPTPTNGNFDHAGSSRNSSQCVGRHTGPGTGSEFTPNQGRFAWCVAAV